MFQKKDVKSGIYFARDVWFFAKRYKGYSCQQPDTWLVDCNLGLIHMDWNAQRPIANVENNSYGICRFRSHWWLVCIADFVKSRKANLRIFLIQGRDKEARLDPKKKRKKERGKEARSYSWFIA